jgi:centromere-localized protein 2
MSTYHPNHNQPTESQILTSYLLHPSPLSTIVPFSIFQTLVPKATATNHPSDLLRLYHDLQFQRDITIDDVRRRIEGECRRSTGLQARLARTINRENGVKRRPKRKRARARRHHEPNDEDEDEDDDGYEETETDIDNDNDSTTEHNTNTKDVEIDRALYGTLGNTLAPRTQRNNHTTTTLLSSMAVATKDIKSEIAALQTELRDLQRECEEAVGGLSDLRYGRLSHGSDGVGVEVGIVEALGELKGKLAGY